MMVQSNQSDLHQGPAAPLNQTDSSLTADEKQKYIQ